MKLSVSNSKPRLPCAACQKRRDALKRLGQKIIVKVKGGKK